MNDRAADVQVDPSGVGLLAHLDRITGAGQSGDGLIRAVVGTSGVPTALEIAPAAMRFAPADLAERIIEALRAAVGDAQAQLASTLPEAASAGPSVAVHASDAARQVQQLMDELVGDFDTVRRRIADTLDGA